MHPVRLAAIAMSALLLAACNGGDKPAAETPVAETSAAVTPVAAAPAAVATPASSRALKSLFGTWAPDLANCGDQAIKISATAFEGAGNTCSVSGYTDNGDGTFTAAMSCSSSGKSADEKVQMRPIFAPSGEGIDLVYLSRNNQKAEVLRCAAAN
jgi:hypothetical protein